MAADFIATLHYKKTEDGGRTGIVYSGYRPLIQFEFDTMPTSGEQKFLGKNEVNPGETVKAEIRIVGVDYFAGKLKEGIKFEFKEPQRVMGTGVI
ncbi:MAG: elongation factor Tu, partial [Ekhidna sp.]